MTTEFRGPRNRSDVEAKAKEAKAKEALRSLLASRGSPVHTRTEVAAAFVGHVVRPMKTAAVDVLRNHAQADDVVAEVLARFFRRTSLDVLESIDRPVAYLCRSARNGALDVLRNETEADEVDANHGADNVDGVETGLLRRAPDPLAILLMKEHGRRVREAAAASADAALLIDLEENGFDYEAAAKASGKNEATIRKQVSRARARFAEVLTNRGVFRCH